MTDKIEIQGKTVEAAVSEALLQLGARRDEVEIKVIEEPKSGFMGFLGGRAAKVLVRKKQSRRRGGSGRDHRVDDNDHKAHNLSGGGGRGRSRRGGSGRKPSRDTAGQGGRDDQKNQKNQKNRNEGRGDSPQSANQSGGESRGGSRRGSRGRGGRGRSQGAAARNENQNQNQNQRPSRDQNQARPAQPVKSETPEKTPAREVKGRSRNERGRRGPENRGDSRPASRPGPQEKKPREKPDTPRTEERPAAKAETGRNRRREAPLPAPVETSTPPVAATQPEKKEVPSVSTPKKPRRAFGGLGARLKERKAAEKAAKEAAANPPKAPAAAPATPSEPAVSAPAHEAPVRQDSPQRRETGYDNRSRGRAAPSFGSSSSDEVILEGIQATKYAKPVGEVTDENLDESLTELTDALLARAGFPCRCDTQPGEYRQIKVTTDDASAGMLIGRHGQTIDAVEHLVERMASNAIDARARINLDINNYRQRREEALAERVSESAERIRETGRAVHLEPMSARERRIVHMEALEFGGLRTFTMDGSGGKHVVIAAEEEATDSKDDSENVDQE